MAHAGNETIIDRPIEDVFAYLADGENNAAWRGRTLEVARTSEHTGPGATYRQVISGPNGRKVRHDYRVATCEPPTRLEFQHIVGLARPTGRFLLTPLDATHTMVRFELDWQPRGVKKIFNQMINKWMASEVTSLDALKRVLEKPTNAAT